MEVINSPRPTTRSLPAASLRSVPRGVFAWCGASSAVRSTDQLARQCNKSAILLDLCVSSLRRGHANLLCIVPIFTDDHRSGSCRLTRLAPISGRLRHHIQNHFCNNRSKNTRLRERSRLFQSKGLSLQRFVVSHHNKLERARVLSRWNVQEEKRQL